MRCQLCTETQIFALKGTISTSVPSVEVNWLALCFVIGKPRVHCPNSGYTDDSFSRFSVFPGKLYSNTIIASGLTMPAVSGIDHCAIHYCIILTCWQRRYIFRSFFNLLKPTGYVMHHQFNIQQLYSLPALYLCVLYLSENKQRLVPLTA